MKEQSTKETKKKLIAILFPGPSKKKIPLLKELVFENLKDPISSVRQGAAQGETIFINIILEYLNFLNFPADF